MGGGVLEHPAGSRAWKTFGLAAPPRYGGWISADEHAGFTCCVDQGWYGHRASKATWLYAQHVQLLTLRWGPAGLRPSVPPTATEDERRRILRTGICQRLSRKQRLCTPLPFRDLLLTIARTAAI